MALPMPYRPSPCLSKSGACADCPLSCLSICFRDGYTSATERAGSGKHGLRRSRLFGSLPSACRGRGALECSASSDGSDRPALKRFSWQLNPERPFSWCDLCGGQGLLVCNRCNGEKYVNTAPGGAGVRFFVGTARCSNCQAMGKTPCPLCSGYEDHTRVFFDDDGEAETFED